MLDIIDRILDHRNFFRYAIPAFIVFNAVMFSGVGYMWYSAYTACTDNLCPGSHAVLSRSWYDTPVCSCAPNK